MAEFKEKVVAEKKVGETTWRVAISTKGSLQLATLRAFDKDGRPTKNGFAIKIENAKQTLSAVSGLCGTLFSEIDKLNAPQASTQTFRLQNSAGKFVKEVKEGKTIVTEHESKAMVFTSLKKIQAFMKENLSNPDRWEIV